MNASRKLSRTTQRKRVMKTREPKTENGGWQTRSVLGCGSKARKAGIVVENATKNSSSSAEATSLAGQKKYGASRGLNSGFAVVLQSGRTYGAVFCFLILHFSFCLRAHAQSYSIEWHNISGGGGTSTNAQYAVTGTIGQPDAGATMAGNYSLTGGFWSFISVVQTPGAPTLHINHSSNSVTVYWQDVPGWTLQTNSNLSASADWADDHAAALLNGTNSLTLTAPHGNLFFRLSH